MGARALVPDRHFIIERRRPNHLGYRERVVFTGNLRDKPKGWRVIRSA